MLSLPLDPDLDRRLRQVAARQGKSPEECALAALRAYVADHEDAAASARALGATDVVRPSEEFWD